jgi:hypothetical protein
VLLKQQRKIDGDISTQTTRVMVPSFSIYESNLLKCFLFGFVSLGCRMVRKFDAQAILNICLVGRHGGHGHRERHQKKKRQMTPLHWYTVLYMVFVTEPTKLHEIKHKSKPRRISNHQHRTTKIVHGSAFTHHMLHKVCT